MIGVKMIPFPNKKYQIIYADPPWPIKWIASTNKRVGIKPLQYQTLPVSEIGLLPVKQIADDNSKLFLWTTNAFLPEALGIVRLWGFHYDKLWTWCKPTCSGGHPRNATEHLIEAVRGSLKKALGSHDKATNNWFIASSNRHSKKPQEIRAFIEKCYPNNPKIELFARPLEDRLFEDESYKGWDVWGDECEDL